MQQGMKNCCDFKKGDCSKEESERKQNVDSVSRSFAEYIDDAAKLSFVMMNRTLY